MFKVKGEKITIEELTRAAQVMTENADPIQIDAMIELHIHGAGDV
jgi:anthranilate phosphoribosyltransferase